MDGSSISTYFNAKNNGSDGQKYPRGLGTRGDLADKEQN